MMEKPAATATAATAPRAAGGGGKWKARFGLGRRNSKKNIIIKANAGAPAPEEPDNGEARKRGLVINSKNKSPDKKSLLNRNSNNNHKLSIKTDFRKESRDASDTSNPQSPAAYSHDSYLTMEVRKRI